jgi:RNA-directed DNA polymerase
VNWHQVNRHVRNLRRRIFRASQADDWRTVNRLQKLMLRSYANRLHAVRRVTQINHGKHTPGIDKLVVLTPTERGKLVDEMAGYQPWRAKPTRRVYIPKANGKRRPLGIPTIRDRALQAMVKNALEPAWEAHFEATSYGFRPGRSAHDAIQRIYGLARTTTARPWVLDADIQGAFDHIDHAYLLRTIGPFPGRAVIKQWLKAGYMECGTLHQTEEGTPQGGVISPLLLNIALHGLEAAVGVRRSVWSGGKVNYSRSDGIPVRYADDFVVFCRTEEQTWAIKHRLAHWLGQRGLAFSEDKTRVVHLEDGFDFLGWTVKRYRVTTTRSGWILLIKPSKDSVATIKERLRQEWHGLRGTNAGAIVRRLNPIIRGWATYHCTQVAAEIFRDLDRYMFWKEVRWIRRTHPHKSTTWTTARYFGALHPQREDRWVFGDKRSGIAVTKFSWHPIQRHVLVKDRASPDDPALRSYWEERQRSRAKLLSPIRYRLAQQQRSRCPMCGDYLLNGEALQVDHIMPQYLGGSDAFSNLRLLHLLCHHQRHAQDKRRMSLLRNGMRATTGAVCGESRTHGSEGGRQQRC